MDKDYIEKVIRQYGNDFTSLDYNNNNYKIGHFYSDFNIDDEKSAVFQIYNVEIADNLFFEIDDKDDDLSYMNDYEMLQFDSYDGMILITIGDLLKGEVNRFYKEVVF